MGHGGKREGSGARKGKIKKKVLRSYRIDKDLVERLAQSGNQSMTIRQALTDYFQKEDGGL